jgi:hypothetical protein
VSACLEKFRCSELSITYLRPLDLSFPRLVTLTLENDHTFDGSDLQMLLANCAHTLKQMILENCSITGPMSAGSPLPDRQWLRMCEVMTDWSTVERLVSASPSLRFFYFDEEHSWEACLDTLAAHCPQLQVFSYNGTSGSQSMTGILTACLKIEVVEFLYDANEVHLLTILQNCVRLKALRAEGWFLEATSECVVALQARLPDRQHLSLKDCGFETNASLLSLAPYCSNLRTLEAQDSFIIRLRCCGWQEPQRFAFHLLGRVDGSEDSGLHSIVAFVNAATP